MYDIAALGESLIDFTPNGINDMGMPLFSQNPGGAPANVLAMAARLGSKTAFIGKVGSDEFGKFLEDNLKNNEIDTSGMIMDEHTPTTLAFVTLKPDGDRSFSFYRKPGADIMLDKSEVKQEIITGCRVFHFGSVSLTDEPSREATLFAAKKAKEAGAVISFDPNYRPFLWPSEEKAVEEILSAAKLADLIKVSLEELKLLCNTADIEQGARQLAAISPRAVFVTLGKGGAYVYTKNAQFKMPAYDLRTVDTTGAGDAFWGAMLHNLSDMKPDEIEALGEKEWERLLKFSNAAGSLTTTKKGAIPAMPGMVEIEACAETARLLKYLG